MNAVRPVLLSISALVLTVFLKNGRCQILVPYDVQGVDAKKIHYASTGAVAGALTGGLAAASLYSKGGFSPLAFSLGSAGGALVGGYLAYPRRVVLNEKWERILFPIFDLTLGLFIGSLSGAIVGTQLNPEADIPLGTIMGLYLGGIIGSASGGILGYKLAVHF